MPVRPLLSALFLVFYSQVAWAEETPSVELLEFLGQWETRDGDWIDPTQYIENPDLAQIDKGESRDE